MDRYVMGWMQRLFFATAVGLFAMAVYGRGGSNRAGLAPEEGVLPGAVLAHPIPLAPGASFSRKVSGQIAADHSGYTSKSWTFRIHDPVAKVVAFYRNNLPLGTREAEAGVAGTYAFQWAPPGAWEGELVSVTVKQGELQIAETVKVGR